MTNARPLIIEDMAHLSTESLARDLLDDPVQRFRAAGDGCVTP